MPGLTFFHIKKIYTPNVPIIIDTKYINEKSRLLYEWERVNAAPPGTARATHVLMAVGAGQVEWRIPIVVLHFCAGLVVQQQQLRR